MNEFPIPLKLMETMLSISAVFVAVMLMFALLHLYYLFNDWQKASRTPWALWRVWRNMYWENKPSIALTVTIASLLFVMLVYVYVLYIFNRQLPHDLIYTYAKELYMMGNAGFIVGVLCWIRNVAPFTIHNWQWVLFTLATFGIGYGVSQLPGSIVDVLTSLI